MSEIASPWAQPLEQRLPVEVTGAGHGWFTRYRIYPVFSGAWVRGRLRVFGVVGAPVAAAMLLLLVRRPGADIPWGGLLNLGVQIWLPLLLGPGWGTACGAMAMDHRHANGGPWWPPWPRWWPLCWPFTSGWRNRSSSTWPNAPAWSTNKAGAAV
jgi:hypothetical protein